MATPDNNGIARWADERLAALDPPESWTPDETRALARLRERRTEARGHGRQWTGLAIAVVAVSLIVIPVPRLRGFAQACGEFVFRGLSGSHAVHRYDASADRELLSDATLRDLDGKVVNLSEYRGKVVLVTYWSTTCGQCESEMSWFSEFRRRYLDQGFEVVGVSVGPGDSPFIQQYVANRPIAYRVVVGDREAVRRHAISIPTTLILDRTGRIAVRHVGYCSKREFETDIKAVLAERRRSS